MIIVDSFKLGYHIELYLKNFRINSTFLDNEMPVNSNKHYTSQFVKGVFNICICCNEYKDNSPNFAKEVIDLSPIPPTIIYFDTIDADLLESHCFNSNVKAIYHLISNTNKVRDFSNIFRRNFQRRIMI